MMGNSIEGIRLTFHKEEIEQAFEWARIIMEKGYEVFMQPVGTAFYSDLELLQLVEKINELNPYAFYIVDTLGSMYRNEVSHRFYLIDENMRPRDPSRFSRAQQSAACVFQRAGSWQDSDQSAR